MTGRSTWRWLPLISSLCLVTLIGLVASGDEPRPVELTDPLPYGAAPINYFSEATGDRIQQLQKRISDGAVELRPDPRAGYLPDLLQALEIPVESQTLVFSKTSVNQALIKPSRPRAIYFNDDLTIGWAPAAAAIEITLQDAVKGTVFYTLPQPADDAPAPAESRSIRFRRDGRCTACHVSSRTLNVPGHIISSFLTDLTGAPREGYSSISHATDYAQRWGGWYVTGKAQDLVHWGNLIGEADARQHRRESTFRGALDDLAPLVDLGDYPSMHSDLVALLVLNHQMHFYNLVNRVSFERRLNRRSDAEVHLVRYALMQDEAPLPGPVTGSSKFAEVYQSGGPRDGQGRSLRELDLQQRLFKYDVSPLVASRSFQSLPGEVKARLYGRLDAELAARDDQTAREILRATVAGWPGSIPVRHRSTTADE